MNLRGVCRSWRVSFADIDATIIRVLMARVCCMRVCVLGGEKGKSVKKRRNERFFF